MNHLRTNSLDDFFPRRADEASSDLSGLLPFSSVTMHALEAFDQLAAATAAAPQHGFLAASATAAAPGGFMQQQCGGMGADGAQAPLFYPSPVTVPATQSPIQPQLLPLSPLPTGVPQMFTLASPAASAVSIVPEAAHALARSAEESADADYTPDEDVEESASDDESAADMEESSSDDESDDDDSDARTPRRRTPAKPKAAAKDKTKATKSTRKSKGAGAEQQQQDLSATTELAERTGMLPFELQSGAVVSIPVHVLDQQWKDFLSYFRTHCRAATKADEAEVKVFRRRYQLRKSSKRGRDEQRERQRTLERQVVEATQSQSVVRAERVVAVLEPVVRQYLTNPLKYNAMLADMLFTLRRDLPQ